MTGVWCSEAIDFIYELGNRISDATGDKMESSFLFQRLSIVLQKGNAACVAESFPLTSGFYIFIFLFMLFLTMISSFFYIGLAGPGV